MDLQNLIKKKSWHMAIDGFLLSLYHKIQIHVT